jgi:hypothetical protein
MHCLVQNNLHIKFDILPYSEYSYLYTDLSVNTKIRFVNLFTAVSKVGLSLANCLKIFCTKGHENLTNGLISDAK